MSSAALPLQRQRELRTHIQKGPEQVKSWVKAAYKTYDKFADGIGDVGHFGTLGRTVEGDKEDSFENDPTRRHLAAQERAQKLALLQDMIIFMVFEIPETDDWNEVAAELNKLKEVFEGHNHQHRNMNFAHGCSLATHVEETEECLIDMKAIHSAAGTVSVSKQNDGTLDLG